jgi:membrane protein DedA with SNARE-associated domain
MKDSQLYQAIIKNAPDVATVATGGGFVATLATANEVLQFIAGILAVATGIFALYWHIRRFEGERKNHGDHDSLDE